MTIINDVDFFFEQSSDHLIGLCSYGLCIIEYTVPFVSLNTLSDSEGVLAKLGKEYFCYC